MNVGLVLAFDGKGSGFSNLKLWCGIMNMPHCLSQRENTKKRKKVKISSIEVFETIVSRSRDAIVKAHNEIAK